jgi:hypothetical protein
VKSHSTAPPVSAKSRAAAITASAKSRAAATPARSAKARATGVASSGKAGGSGPASAAPTRSPRTSGAASSTATSSTAASGAARASSAASDSSPASSGDPAASSSARDETLATRDVGRLLRYGERFGTDRIDVRMLPLQLPVRSGALGVFDPAAPQTWRVLERRTGSGAFRVMLSVARPDEGPSSDRLAAVVIHVGRPPIARWNVAQFDGSTPASDGLPRTPTRSGWLAIVDASEGAPGVLALPPSAGVTPVEVLLTDGRRALAMPCGNGEFVAYWAIDAADKPICIVFDFDAFTQKAWKAKPPPGTT